MPQLFLQIQAPGLEGLLGENLDTAMVSSQPTTVMAWLAHLWLLLSWLVVSMVQI